MKLTKFKKLGSDIKLQAQKLSQEGLKQLFDHINQLNIKKGVDKMGLDKFIEQCAYLAAGSGIVSGSGGMFTMIAGIPFDFANLVTQQFRVTLAIMYYNRGSYEIGFEEFMSLVATSLKVEAGVTLSKTMMEGIAEKLLKLLRDPDSGATGSDSWRGNWRGNQLYFHQKDGRIGKENALGPAIR